MAAKVQHYRMVVLDHYPPWDDQPMVDAEADGWTFTGAVCAQPDTEVRGYIRFYFLYGKKL